MNLIEDATNGAPLRIGVRPEDVGVSGRRSTDGTLRARSSSSRWAARRWSRLEYRGQRLVARVPADRHFEAGQPAWIHLPRNARSCSIPRRRADGLTNNRAEPRTPMPQPGRR